MRSQLVMDARTKFRETDHKDQQESQEASVLGQELLSKIRGVEEGVFLDDLLLSVDDTHDMPQILGVIRELMADKLVALVVVSYSWGVEFALKGLPAP